jgi:hypothetical protein
MLDKGGKEKSKKMRENLFIPFVAKITNNPFFFRVCFILLQAKYEQNIEKTSSEEEKI